MLNLSAPLLKLVEVVDSTYATAHQLAATASDSEAGDGHRGLCALLAQTEDALALMANKLIFLLIKVRTCSSDARALLCCEASALIGTGTLMFMAHVCRVAAQQP